MPVTVPTASCPAGTKNKPTSLAGKQEKPYIALSGEGRLRLGIAQASLALHSACTALDAGNPRVE